MIGQCWAKGEEEIHETEDVWRNHLRSSKQDWRSAPRETRAGLSFRDFKAIRGKYKGGMAVPITGENSEVLGVLAMDVARNGDTSIWCLVHEEVLAVLKDTAADVSGLIRNFGRPHIMFGRN